MPLTVDDLVADLGALSVRVAADVAAGHVDASPARQAFEECAAAVGRVAAGATAAEAILEAQRVIRQATALLEASKRQRQLTQSTWRSIASIRSPDPPKD